MYGVHTNLPYVCFPSSFISQTWKRNITYTKIFIALSLIIGGKKKNDTNVLQLGIIKQL